MGTVRVGFAKQAISACCNPAGWPVHNDLYGGVIWIDDGGAPAALCALDYAEMGGHQVDLVKAILQRETGLDPGRVVVTFSHTHAVGTMDPLALGARLAEIAGLARNAAQPARVRYVRTDVGRQFSVNRRLHVSPELGALTVTFYHQNKADLQRGRMEVSGQARDFLRYGMNPYHPAYARAGADPAKGPAQPSAEQARMLAALPKKIELDGPVDPNLEAIQFVLETGRVIGTLTRFACHPVAFTGPLLSADFPGVLTAQLAKSTGAPVLFMNGPSGDLKPLIRENGPAEMQRVGQGLAVALEKALAAGGGAAAAEPLTRFQFARREEWFDLCPDMLHVPASATDALAREYAQSAAQPFEPQEHRCRLDRLLRTWAASPECYGDNLQRRMLFSATLWGFNEIRLVTLPGEMFQAFGAQLRAEFPGSPLMVVELADTDRTGYVPTREEFEWGGYEVAASCLPPGSGERLTALAAELIRAAE